MNTTVYVIEISTMRAGALEMALEKETKPGAEPKTVEVELKACLDALYDKQVDAKVKKYIAKIEADEAANPKPSRKRG